MIHLSSSFSNGTLVLFHLVSISDIHCQLQRMLIPQISYSYCYHYYYYLWAFSLHCCSHLLLLKLVYSRFHWVVLVIATYFVDTFCLNHAHTHFFIPLNSKLFVFFLSNQFSLCLSLTKYLLFLIFSQFWETILLALFCFLIS